MPEQTEDMNIIKLLMEIKEDVSSIKTDMSNFKESQKSEKEMILKEIEDVRNDYEKDVKELKKKVDSLTNDVTVLKQSDDKKDAKKWRTVIAFILTAIGGMAVVKIPDFVVFLVRLNLLKGA